MIIITIIIKLSWHGCSFLSYFLMRWSTYLLKIFVNVHLVPKYVLSNHSFLYGVFAPQFLFVFFYRHWVCLVINEMYYEHTLPIAIYKSHDHRSCYFINCVIKSFKIVIISYHLKFSLSDQPLYCWLAKYKFYSWYPHKW